MLLRSTGLYYSRNRPLRIPNLGTLVKYSALAFLSSNQLSCSFSLSSSSSSLSLVHAASSPHSSSSIASNALFGISASARSSSSSPTTTTIAHMTSSSSTTEDATSTTTTTTDWKLESLRAKMASCNLDALIVPTDDPHLSEYVPEAYGRRKFLTGFKGSAGTALVTKDKAYLWTDSRYGNTSENGTSLAY